MNAPYLVICNSSEATSYQVMVKQPTTEASTFGSALLDLYSSYFVYIAYPKPFYSLLVFIQHILGLNDEQADPPVVIEITTSLTSMESTL